MTSYVVATTRPWNLREYARFSADAPGEWHLIDRPDGLTLDTILRIQPRYVFFPHWSWKVPAEISEAAECVLFHMTDLPYGRGGSPLQNLIVRGHKDTQVSAIRMTADIDAGPVYLKRPLLLNGSAEEIFLRLSNLVFSMIADIVAGQPNASPQTGQPVFFTRRTPAQSILPAAGSAQQLYDHIRMLDAETYPAAFLDFENWRIEFRQARLAGEGVEAQVFIRPRSEKVHDGEQ
jgi:methionyl-tRNA formyltransferase